MFQTLLFIKIIPWIDLNSRCRAVRPSAWRHTKMRAARHSLSISLASWYRWVTSRRRTSVVGVSGSLRKPSAVQPNTFIITHRRLRCEFVATYIINPYKNLVTELANPNSGAEHSKLYIRIQLLLIQLEVTIYIDDSSASSSLHYLSIRNL